MGVTDATDDAHAVDAGAVDEDGDTDDEDACPTDHVVDSGTWREGLRPVESDCDSGDAFNVQVVPRAALVAPSRELFRQGRSRLQPGVPPRRRSMDLMRFCRSRENRCTSTRDCSAASCALSLQAAAQPYDSIFYIAETFSTNSFEVIFFRPLSRELLRYF